MSECPFCGAGVSEDLVTYGGTCPKCFAEIPGEEAATDPGVEVKAAQDRRDHRRARMRAVIGLTALLLLVSCTGIVAFAMLLWPEPEVAELLDFDTLGLPEVEIVGADDLAGGTSSGGGTRTARDRAELFVNEGGGIDRSRTGLGDDPTATGNATQGTRLRTEINPISPELGGGVARTGPGGSVDLSIDAPKLHRDENVVLSDPAAIRQMIGERMVEYIPGLTMCYERRLKLKPSLQGRWKLNFTVLTTGFATDITATAVDRGDREFESCLVEHVRENWRFGKITVNQPIQKTLKFAH